MMRSITSMTDDNPQFLLFAQHGWADTGKAIGKLAQIATANSSTLIIAPSLGLIKTFIRIEPLIKRLEQIATQVINNYPHVPIKIMGHSMGGLLWLEVLNRNPQWWHKVHSLILLGSPVGGSNIARIIDPLGIGVGTARDLGKNRRDLAERIAQQIPTLSVASDIDLGSDGLVTVENTKFAYANWLLILGVQHDAMRYHADIIPIIQEFWKNPQLGLPAEDNASQFIKRLRSVPGMTDAGYHNFGRSQIIASFADGTTLHTWNNLLGINHVYIGNSRKECLYAGYVGSIHNFGLRQAVKEIQQYIS
ncbi:serine aminopeptidase domain-containing protein [Pleurocapsa sp. FMAR1]|uniref:serine aminopeptidase domain-containing protein n=1 Tax=Pleurocapsa sp. FMAR1 TaxID=3040204 RepID=UPI0029C7E2D7|nr:alpha/beta hydrolase [Pleurocapsa sp. FMAR1]